MNSIASINPFYKSPKQPGMNGFGIVIIAYCLFEVRSRGRTRTFRAARYARRRRRMGIRGK